jgi:hypothetical protein
VKETVDVSERIHRASVTDMKKRYVCLGVRQLCLCVIIVPEYEIFVSEYEIIAPDHEICVPDCEIFVPGREIMVMNACKLHIAEYEVSVEVTTFECDN